MATSQQIFPGYRRQPVDPMTYARQRAASTQADIAARAEAARLLAEQKAAADEARIRAQSEAEALKRKAAFDALTTKTNADWNELVLKQADKNKPKPIRITDKDEKTGRSITRELTPDEFKAETKAKKLADLTAQRDLLKGEWQMPFGLSRVPAQIAAVEEQIKAESAPTDLLAPAAAAPVAAPAAPAGPTPRGFIGSPGANVFLNEPAPLGMNRAQTNAYAIDLNNRETPPPRDLLTSESFPSGYDPGHGSFQLDPNPVTNPIKLQDAPPIPFPAAEATQPPKIPNTHIKALMADPEKLSGFFNEKYGEGAAENILQSAMQEAESQP